MAGASDEVDVIIAGGMPSEMESLCCVTDHSWVTIGGTSGCIVASRLTKAEPKLKVLLIEDGADQQHNPNTYRLGMWKENLTPTSNTVQIYHAKPNARLNGRSTDAPLGRGLGGCSLIQNGLYTRPVPA
jgi:alcohol oxidase